MAIDNQVVINRKMAEVLAIKADFERFDEWVQAFRESDLKLVRWEDLKEGQAIDYALVWQPTTGMFDPHPEIKIIFSIGAGVDHMLGENVLPKGVPVVRMVETNLTLGMTVYVTYQILRHHRFMPLYEQFQRDKNWKEIIQIPASRRNVGIMGMGVLGTACAQVLKSFGFRLFGWSRSEKHIEGIEHYHGPEQLHTMLSYCDFLICLLPNTQETNHILCAKNLMHLPKQAVLINVGRGSLLVENDLITLLDSDHLSAAVLDVFQEEPLPTNSPLWNHPRITITPHVASMTVPETSAEHIWTNIKLYRLGHPLTHVADMQRGY